jgi:hypothetical protein
LWATSLIWILLPSTYLVFFITWPLPHSYIINTVPYWYLYGRWAYLIEADEPISLKIMFWYQFRFYIIIYLYRYCRLWWGLVLPKKTQIRNSMRILIRFRKKEFWIKFKNSLHWKALSKRLFWSVTSECRLLFLLIFFINNLLF